MRTLPFPGRTWNSNEPDWQEPESLRSNLPGLSAVQLRTRYRRLRDLPAWRLLASDLAPTVLSLLQTHLMEGEGRLPASLLYERLERDLDLLRLDGSERLPQSAQAYVAEWLREGWLERRFPEGAGEEVYELSLAGATALRLISSLDEPPAQATESRLATVIEQLIRLAEATDPNPETRIQALERQRDRLEREIEAVRSGRSEPMERERALEHTRDLLQLAEGLLGDFRRVREQFERLNLELRDKITENEGSRGEVLEALFAGVDVIGESEAGKSFAAFWRLLTDPERSGALDWAVDEVLKRDFAHHLELPQRRFLRRLTRLLLDQGGNVHDVQQHFARSLKQFVQSREYLEQRHLLNLLREASRLSLGLRDQVHPTQLLPFELELTSSRLRSLSQWSPFDPELHVVQQGLRQAQSETPDLERLAQLLDEAEIDFRRLRENILEALRECSQVSVGELLGWFPATQGLGTVVGYLALASRHGTRLPDRESVSWEGRSASIPKVYFTRERAHELR